MTQLDVTPPPRSIRPAEPGLMTAAAREAVNNCQANLEALTLTQPMLAHRRVLARDVEWLHARDGALSATIGGEWWSGCSVPREASRVILRTLQATGTACYLRPAHACELAMALRMLPGNQAVVAVVPDPGWLDLALHCHDFSEAIRGNRLWFATGAGWVEELRKIFADHPALPIPNQLIRTPLLDGQEAELLVAAVQRVLGEVASKRDGILRTLLERPRRCTSSSVKRLCVVAPSRYRLWDDAGATLSQALKHPATSSEPFDCRTLDPDDPCSSGPMAITFASRFCDALVVADRARAHLGSFVPAMVSVVTWVTNGTIPRHDPTAGRDALMLADPAWVALAVREGWPEHRLAVAQWPVAGDEKPEGMASVLAIVADTVDVTSTAPAMDLSSHRLLWEMIQQEVLEDPLAVGAEPEKYLSDRMARLGVPKENFDKRRFVEQLIVPAYQQGLARLLVREGLPVRLHGHGWEQIAEFSSRAAGPVRGRDELRLAVRDAVAVHAWPSATAHPIESLGRRVLRRPRTTAQGYLNTARALLCGGSPPRPPHDPLSAYKILTLL